MTRTAVIAGASGLVGGRCLAHLLAHPDVARVTALVRKPLALAGTLDRLEKLAQRTVAFPDVIDAVPKDVDDAYCALGTTMKAAGSREAFLAVDRDAVLGFARACRSRGARRFILVSSGGADERSVVFYLRTKGEVEHGVAALGFESVHILRPSVLDGDRVDSRPAERLSIAILSRVARVLPRFAPIHVDTVGKAMVALAFSEARGVVCSESRALQALVGA